MRRLAVSVEGQTEEAFVKSSLAGHLRPLAVEPTPVLVGRARGAAGGGGVSVKRLAEEMAALYRSHDFVTSLVDFYGFSGRGDRTVDQLQEHIGREVRGAVARDWDERRVVPYVQSHEFEGLLFSDVRAFAVLADVSESDIARLESIRSRFETPEDINLNPETAPSRRIAGVIPGYSKAVDGPDVASEMGLAAIRGQCPRFDAWVGHLESMGR